jgi:hypothetical protein
MRLRWKLMTVDGAHIARQVAIEDHAIRCVKKRRVTTQVTLGRTAPGMVPQNGPGSFRNCRTDILRPPMVLQRMRIKVHYYKSIRRDDLVFMGWLQRLEG